MATNKQESGGHRPHATSPGRWLRNNREVAKFLKLKASQRQLRMVGEWRLLSDFPVKQKKGFVGEEVRAWYLRFAAAQAKADAPLIAARQIIENKRIPGRRALQSLEDGNIQHSTFNAQHSSEGGSVDLGATAENGVDPSRAVESIRQMAVVASRFFRRHITEQKIKVWLAGELPAGAPPFPLRDPGRNGWSNPSACFEWMRNFYVNPTSAEGGLGQEELFHKTRREAEMAELLTTLHGERTAKAIADAKEREVSAKWILRAQATGTATRAMSDLMHIVETEFERNAPQRRRERLAGLLAKIGEGRSEMSGTPGPAPANSDLQTAISEFSAWDAQDERERMDRIRAACARAGAVGETSNIEH